MVESTLDYKRIAAQNLNQSDVIKEYYLPGGVSYGKNTERAPDGSPGYRGLTEGLIIQLPRSGLLRSLEIVYDGKFPKDSALKPGSPSLETPDEFLIPKEHLHILAEAGVEFPGSDQFAAKDKKWAYTVV